MARKVVLYIAASLDGFIAKEDDDLNWLEEMEVEGDCGYSEFYQSIDTVIMGKRTYDYILKHAEMFPYPDKKCYVFSTSKTGSDEHVEFVNEDVGSFTKNLKEEQGSNIWMAGGGSILDDFMKSSLIDEYIITVTPHLLGKGVSLFKDHNPETELVLIKVNQYGQMVQLHYKIKN
ncbi:dihydrofolate reductase family protein [Bacillus carboniphilus]|uniref:Dihydrofolate reductase family protein n=1 Tax=Bacillus carboniphilus TaxID=86663 RepID=A0ABY9JT74_9BACI|nr:dihydrofolate reductase family protein [Bacillus carboniphilus]WLR42580.1 dihydrofolate reductase family protein [Bacillus carboniphilus]